MHEELVSPNFISNFVKEQFPSFYRDKGPEFIAFVEAYYKWLQGSAYFNLNLLAERDIDHIRSEFLDHYVKKYMPGFPKLSDDNIRFLQKHILEFYRSKGSKDGLKLLFKLLYNEEINIYIPSKDILRASDGVWLRDKYLEISESEYNTNFQGKIITGSASGSQAYVSNYVKFFKGGKQIFLLYITDNIGTFQTGEKVSYEGLQLLYAPTVVGSPTGVAINYSTPNHKPGDILIATNGDGEGLKLSVGSIRDASISNGNITFSILDGGFGYTNAASVYITAGSNTSGGGADFRVGEISNPRLFRYNTNFIAPVANTLLSAPSYGSTLNNTNVNNLLVTALTDIDGIIGTIASLTQVNPGFGYDGSVSVEVIDHYIHGYFFNEPGGEFFGNNAIIIGDLELGSGFITSVSILDSGFGYYTDNQIINFVNTANSSYSASMTIDVEGFGQGEGYWKDTRGFLNSDKYLQDSYYYQEFSYEIQSSKAFSTYSDTIKKTAHPAGNEMFGKTFILSEIDQENYIVNAYVTVTP